MVEFVSELWDLFKVAVLPIMISSMSYGVLKRSKGEKTGRTMWINSLRTCKKIDKPLNEFENATVFESKKMMFDIILKPIFGGLFYSFILFIILVSISFLTNLHPTTQPYFYMFMGLLIVAINILFIDFNVDETKFNGAINYEKRCKDLIMRKSRINNSIFYFNSFALYLLCLYGKKVYEQAISDTTSLISISKFILITIDNYYFSLFLLWVVGVIIGISAYLLTKNNYNAFLNKYETFLNSKYKAGYPFVETNIPELKGKVESIFDKDFLILNNNGVKKIIPWDSLKYLEITCGEF